MKFYFCTPLPRTRLSNPETEGGIFLCPECSEVLDGFIVDFEFDAGDSLCSNCGRTAAAISRGRANGRVIPFRKGTEAAPMDTTIEAVRVRTLEGRIEIIQERLDRDDDDIIRLSPVQIDLLIDQLQKAKNEIEQNLNAP